MSSKNLITAPAAASIPELPTFDPTIPSPVVMCPQDGDFGKVGVRYAVNKLRSLEYESEALLADLTAEQNELRAKLALLQDQEDSLEKRQSIRAWNTAWAINYRAVCLRLLDYYGLDVPVWPFAGAPPNPHQPESWVNWPTAVLDWLTSDAATDQAREGFDGFLVLTVSSPPDNSEDQIL